jgi:uncharacterized protein (TIGR00369 family)
MDLVEAEDGHALMRMEIGPHHANLNSVVHGGAIASLADQAAMRAYQTRLPEGQSSTTIQMDIHYLAPASGKALFASARIIKMGRTLGFTEVQVTDDQEMRVAVAHCVLTLVEKKGKRSPTATPAHEHLSV